MSIWLKEVFSVLSLFRRRTAEPETEKTLKRLSFVVVVDGRDINEGGEEQVEVVTGAEMLPRAIGLLTEHGLPD